MGGSCSIIPKVKGNDGSITDSRLFKDLMAEYGINRRSISLYHIVPPDTGDFEIKMVSLCLTRPL